MWVHAITHGSRANGPGVRSVIHLAGCTQGCKGCFSPHTWTREGAVEMTPYEAASELWRASPDGVSISGGEPLEQLVEVTEMARLLHQWSRNTVGLPKGILLYSGTTAVQRRYMQGGAVGSWDELKRYLDAAVLGPYVQRAAVERATSLVSSANQVVEVYGRRITSSELLRVPSVEVKIGANGEAVVMGFPNQQTLDALGEKA